jgi:ribose-phosphate pyrophosphokinase
MKISKYPDGTSYVNIERTGEEIMSLWKLNSYEDLWHLNQFVDAYNNKYHQRPLIIIPNLIDAQADRRFADNQSSGLKLVCKFLNSMNADFKIFHPHNPEVVEALMDNVEIIDNKDFIIKTLSKIKGHKFLYGTGGSNDRDTESNLILMSSDAGGFKPLMKLCDNIKWEGETYSASKSRSFFGTPHSSCLRQIVDRSDFYGKDILIVDDISVYGGTFKGLSKLLRERNCGKLYLAVSHMTMQNLGEDPVTNYFDKVFTTNSKFEEYYLNKGFKPFDSTNKPQNLEIIKQF